MKVGRRKRGDREPSLPQIVSIDQMETILPRYVWVDEDQNQVSPIHKELRSALNFINGWDGRFERLQEEFCKDEDLTPNQIKQDPRFQKAWSQMTRSGKPPIELKRVVIEIKIEEISDEEKGLSSIMLGRK